MADFYYVYVSLWAGHGSQPGLALYKMEKTTGELRFVKKLNDRISFNCSVYDPVSGLLFVNNETDRVGRTNLSGGRFYAFRVDAATGDLEERFYVDTHTPNPSFINVTRDGQYLIEAHHSTGGTVSRFRKNAAGEWENYYVLDDPTIQLYKRQADGSYRLADVKVHEMENARVVDRRLQSCHPHCVAFSPDEELVAIPDKGDFCLYLYRLDREKDELVLLSKTPTGGPARYCYFHPTRPFLFLNHELAVNKEGREHTTDGDTTVCSYRYDENGALTPVSEVSALNGPVPEGGHYEQQGFSMSPDGAFLYTEVSGPDIMTCLRVDQETGALSVTAQVPIPGERPRGTAITPDGRFVLAGCMVDGTLNVYRAEQDGGLTWISRADENAVGASYMTILEP